MKISVISSGSWGTALAKVLCDNEHIVTMWSRTREYADEMQHSRYNSRYLPGEVLPEKLFITSDFSAAVKGAELLIVATPTQHIRSTFEMLKEFENLPPIVNVSKGIEVSSLKRISEICSEVLGAEQDYVVLSGPSHAEEVMRCVPTAVLAASTNDAAAELVQKAFMNDTYFRTYTSNDVIGAELGGALKNIFAIAAGITDGMEFGDNTKAALMTRGIVEMARLGEALGGRAETFNGLSGIGDLIVTCTSRHSRNRHVGEELGRGKSLEKIIEDMGFSVAEGVKTTKGAYDLAAKLDVDIPIIRETYDVLYNDRNAGKAVQNLMMRDAKKERI